MDGMTRCKKSGCRLDRWKIVRGLKCGIHFKLGFLMMCEFAGRESLRPAVQSPNRAPKMGRVSGQLLSMRRTTKARRVLDFRSAMPEV